MSTKTLTITEEAYKRLASLKRGKDSFSDVINREIGKKNLMNYFGILSKEAGEALEKSVMEGRKRHRKMRSKRLERIEKQWRGED